MKSIDPALWTTRPLCGPAAGPDVIVLTDEGNARAFSFGAQLRRGAPAEALEELWVRGGEAYLDTRHGARLFPTPLGRFDRLAWDHLRARGLVEPFQDQYGQGVRLTDTGERAVRAGFEERDRLLARCRNAPSAPS